MQPDNNNENSDQYAAVLHNDTVNTFSDVARIVSSCVPSMDQAKAVNAALYVNAIGSAPLWIGQKDAVDGIAAQCKAGGLTLTVEPATPKLISEFNKIQTNTAFDTRVRFTSFLGQAAGVVLFCAGIPAWQLITLGYPAEAAFVFCLISVLGGVATIKLQPRQEAIRACQRNDYAKALLLCEAVLQKHEDLFLLLLASGCAINIGVPEKGVDYATRAITKAPSEPQAWHYRALAHLNLRHIDLAIHDAQHALTLKASYSEAYIALASAYLMKYDYETAIQTTYKFRQPESADAQLIRVSAFMGMNQTEKAYAICEQALSMYLYPHNRQSFLLQQAAVHTLRGDFQKSYELLEEAFAINANLPEALINHAWTSIVAGNYSLAQESFEKLAKVPLSVHDRGFYLSNQARFAIANGDAQSGLPLAEEALTFTQRIPPILCTRALALSRLSRFDEALQDANEAIVKDRFCAEAYWFRAEIYERLGNVQLAEKDRNTAKQFGYLPWI